MKNNSTRVGNTIMSSSTSIETNHGNTFTTPTTSSRFKCHGTVPGTPYATNTGIHARTKSQPNSVPYRTVPVFRVFFCIHGRGLQKQRETWDGDAGHPAATADFSVSLFRPSGTGLFPLLWPSIARMFCLLCVGGFFFVQRVSYR
jgi:hypothetical protein